MHLTDTAIRGFGADASAETAFPRTPAEAISGPVRFARNWTRAWRSHREFTLLHGADERLLRDIGLTRADLNGILAEPWWGRSSRQLMRAAIERRNQAIARAGGL